MTREASFRPVLFGLAAGITATLLLPGHHAAGLSLTAVLSLLGGLGGNWVAEAALPLEAAGPGAYILSGLGAFAVLLVYSLARG